MSRWRFLDSVPKDGTTVLFWVPSDDSNPLDDGKATLGHYSAGLDCYFDSEFHDTKPIAWQPCPRGPRSLEEICEDV